MANPTLLTMPLCQNADKNTIPPTDAGTSGLFSEEYGWQNINSLPLGSGGKAPNRRDFNGVFALLGGIAYACQRGQTFEWVNNLPYLAGCVVKDPLDGNKYNALNDAPAGGTNPSLDPTNWELFGRDPNALTREITPAFNTRDVITTSGTYTAPVTGWYKVTAKGGGGGGGSGSGSGLATGGGGGGEGGTTIAYVSMTAGETATVVVGAGGTGGVTESQAGTNGGNTTISIGGNSYTATGGSGGSKYTSGVGGTGTINGSAGGSGSSEVSATNYGAPAGSGGGAGGGAGTLGVTGANGTQGGGGAGGGAVAPYTWQHGGNGGDGFVWFEYFATV